MTSSLLFWTACAVLLFWSVGAYNRLVRLRAEANAAFAVLDKEMLLQAALVQTCVAADDGSAGAEFWAGLQGAAAQFTASLAAARVRPLDPERIAALSSARSVLTTAWERAERDDLHDLAGARLPEHVTRERSQLVRQGEAAAQQFNAAVAQYNDAIVQFPAVLMAWLFGFKPAQPLAP